MSPREPSPQGLNANVDVAINNKTADNDTPKPTTVDEISSPDRPFDNVLNLRDVGVHINRLCGTRVVREGVLFRSARPDNASKSDRHRFAEELRLASIIDLRSTTEHNIAANRQLATQLSNGNAESPPASQPQSIANDEHLVQLPGVRRIMISLAGWNFEKLLLWRLSWFNILKAITLLASGYRNAATKLVVEQAMVPRGLNGLAHDTLTASQEEIKELFGHLGDPAVYPTLIHCTQGKDRTGLVIILLLLLAGSPGSDEGVPSETREEQEEEEPGGNINAGGVLRDGDTDVVRGAPIGPLATCKIPLSAITCDYRVSEDELIPELEERLAEMQAMGLPAEYAKCPTGFTEEVVRFLEEGYGGVRGYLKAIGVEDGDVETVRGLLVA
ncbi:tyrosine/serine protein phosphatase [Blastomyces dermatitidis ATCC 18188]|uniref:Tyrosine/serine protein phosphatase n=1 Tax=Ajellomyces dermatitidis (strain ATCC 18188 / CBS 674.68) TaxID=653446 RepID=F2T2Q2_AJEDA|nr:tyrosine/serine protein phosphatase [Blastomyces dermatitidis ATCC 18188]EQL38783.1 hypothetical protein BDFG_00314 [Blastomyces dermatitidis ATCC 26199]